MERMPGGDQLVVTKVVGAGNISKGVMNGNSGPLMEVQEAKGPTKTNRKWKRAARAGPGAKNLGPGEHSPIQKMLIASQVIRRRRRSGSKSPSAISEDIFSP
ncbi:hypothetical protein ACOSQ2_027637 [Xanthoceras sorbifolium]